MTAVKKQESTYSAKHKRYYERNKEKRAAAMKVYRQQHRDKALAYAKDYYKANKARLNEMGRQWRSANLHVEKAANKKWREANKELKKANGLAWARKNPDRVNAAAARHRGAKLRATPKWANEFFIDEAYHLAALRTKMLGYPWHVDHIVPLQSKLVCGLHVHNNLQVIPGIKNISKGNRVWPDMPMEAA